jgi:hypothetical protein
MVEDDLIRLLAGQIEVVVVGTLNPPAVSLLAAQTPLICIAKKELIHILNDHDDHITLKDLMLMPAMITDGLIIKEHHRPNRLVSCFELSAQKRYCLAMKLAKGGHEGWISTLHRTKPKQTQRYLARGVIIQNHK